MKEFGKFIFQNSLEWPRYIFDNQQGRRMVQQSIFRIRSNGEVSHYERFTVKLQAPGFNFTFGSDLPRLGYLTYMDLFLVLAFVVTALTVICNVFLKRMSRTASESRIEKIDRYIVWGYPSVYVVGLTVAYWIYFS